MTTGAAPKSQLTWRGFVGLMGFFAGLCTIFALVVTVAEAWQEHDRAQWPVATARIQGCDLDPVSTGSRDKYYIRCRLSYVVGGEEVVAKVYSRSVPGPNIWQYPPNQIGPLQEWVDEHPPGTPIAVRYDPEKHEKAVLVATDSMLLGGPRTPSNLKLLQVAAASCLVLLTIARITQPRSDKPPGV